MCYLKSILIVLSSTIVMLEGCGIEIGINRQKHVFSVVFT